jgi:hypothetical protein
MHVRYLWVLHYKNLVRQGFQLDPTLAVQYEASTGVLTIERVPPIVPPRFFGPRISNVTGILGANGAGKSTLLEFIQNLVGSFRDSFQLQLQQQHEAILIADQYVLYHESLPLDLKRSQLAGFIPLVYRGSLVDNADRPDQPDGPYREFYDFALVAYSNHFDPVEDNDNPNVMDVSTSHRLNQSIRQQQLAERPDPASLLPYQTAEFEIELNVLGYLVDNQLPTALPFALPRYLSLTVPTPDQVPPLRGLDAAFLEANQATALAGWYRQLTEDFLPNRQMSPFAEFRRRLISLHLLMLLRLYPQALSSISPAARAALRNLTYRRLDLPANVLVGLRGLRAFVRFLESLHEGERLHLPRRGTERWDMRHDTVQLQATSAEERSLLGRLLGLRQLGTLGEMQLTQLRWAGLSTGQAAYLRLYARLFEARRRVRQRNAETYYPVRRLMVLVDEGETNFHPQWQKQFMDVLLGILNTFFADYEVQLLVCSNSPFIASDLPKSHLILLQRDPEGLGVVQSWVGREQTFAANIHSLLTDSFFLQGGLLGDFAKRKLDELLRYLAAPTSAPVALDAEAAHQLLDLVGEPVIRAKLQELWRERFGPADEIARLRQRIQELEQRQPPRD